MTCENAILLISGHLDGENTPQEEAQLQAHLSACSDCRKLMSAFASIETNTAALEAPVPEGLKRGVMYRIEKEANPKKQKKRFRYAGTLVGAVAAALVLMVGLGAIRIPALRTRQTAVQPAGETAAIVPDRIGTVDNSNLIADDKHAVQSQEALDVMQSLVKDFLSPRQTSQSDEPQAIGRYARQDVTEEIVGEYTLLSREEKAPVLIYSEFGCDSLMNLLKAEEPGLFTLVAKLRPEVRSDGTVVVKTSYGAVMALHEWILEHLPETDEAAMQQAQAELIERVKVLDTGGLLTTVITWAGKDRTVRWPEFWPEGWADRVRREFNWQLIFPSETFTPAADSPAYLVLLPVRGE